MVAATAPQPERFVVFPCGADRCIGVLSPAVAAASTAVLIIVGGPQYRVGSHREFALLARALAAGGVPALRFDYCGMGDSEGAARTFESIDDDIAAAIDALCRETGVSRVILWGLCDGASAAFMFDRDPRVAAIVAVNPWVRSHQGAASTRLRHYYLQRLTSASFWRKLLTGKVDAGGALGGLAQTARAAAGGTTDTASGPFLQRMEAGWRNAHRRVLVVLSGRDLTAREFEDWLAAPGSNRDALCAGPLGQAHHFPDADHTFSTGASRAALIARTIEWIRQLPP